MNLLIISASQRSPSQSAKVARYFAETTHSFDKINLIELCQLNIPLWDGEESSKAKPESDWSTLQAQIINADALVFITPEWSGTASPLLKNFLMMCEAQHCAHKPALLVSVVDGISGAYPIAELRMNAFKNNKFVAIPDHLIIRNVTEILNNFTEDNGDLSRRDHQVRERIAYSMHTLIHYAKSLQSLRAALANNPFPNEESYQYGM